MCERARKVHVEVRKINSRRRCCKRGEGGVRTDGGEDAEVEQQQEEQQHQPLLRTLKADREQLQVAHVPAELEDPEDPDHAQHPEDGRAVVRALRELLHEPPAQSQAAHDAPPQRKKLAAKFAKTAVLRGRQDCEEVDEVHGLACELEGVTQRIPPRLDHVRVVRPAHTPNMVPILYQRRQTNGPGTNLGEVVRTAVYRLRA